MESDGTIPIRVEETRTYLQEHKILELFNNMTSQLIFHRPGMLYKKITPYNSRFVLFSIMLIFFLVLRYGSYVAYEFDCVLIAIIFQTMLFSDFPDILR